MRPRASKRDAGSRERLDAGGRVRCRVRCGSVVLPRSTSPDDPNLYSTLGEVATLNPATGEVHGTHKSPRNFLCRLAWLTSARPPTRPRHNRRRPASARLPPVAARSRRSSWTRSATRPTRWRTAGSASAENLAACELSNLSGCHRSSDAFTRAFDAASESLGSTPAIDTARRATAYRRRRGAAPSARRLEGAPLGLEGVAQPPLVARAQPHRRRRRRRRAVASTRRTTPPPGRLAQPLRLALARCASSTRARRPASLRRTSASKARTICGLPPS